MDFPTPNREFSAGRSEASEASPLFDSPEPTVPVKKRRNSAGGASNNGRRVATGRVHKRSAGSGTGSRAASASAAAAASAGPPMGNTGSNDHGGGGGGGGGTTRPIELEPITEDMTEEEKRLARERNAQAEAAYNDDRRRNNQSAKRSRLKKEMYMVEMDMAIKSYRRNVMEYKEAYETAKAVLVRHQLFSEAELGGGFKEPELWKRPMFMPEQENDIADHRSKLERAALQADLPKLGLDFADKVYELVGRTPPLADKDSAVKALAEHHQKIEDCERKQYQLLLQLHEFERKMEETKAKMQDQQRRKQELDMAAEKYKHIGGDIDAEVAVSGGQYEAAQVQVQVKHGQVSEGMDLDHTQRQSDDLFGVPDSKIVVPLGGGQAQQQPQQQSEDGRGLSGKRKEVGTRDIVGGGLDSPIVAPIALPSRTIAAEEEDEDHKAFLDEIEEFVQNSGMTEDTSMDSTMIKPDLFDDAMFSGLPVVDSESQIFGGLDEIVSTHPGPFPFQNHHHHQGFDFSGGHQQQLSSPAPGSVHTFVGHPTVIGSDGANHPFSSPVFGTPTAGNWPGAAAANAHLRHNTPVSPPISQGIFLGNGASNVEMGQQPHPHPHPQNGHIAWPTHPQFHHPHGQGRQQQQQQHGQQVASTSTPLWHPHAQALARDLDDGYIEICDEGIDDGNV